MSQIDIAKNGPAKLVTRRNRRATIRYRCPLATTGRVFASDDREFQRAWILDLSITGIGMQLTRPIELGCDVTIAIRISGSIQMHELSAKVMRCSAVPFGDWYVGCELAAALTPDQLDQLL